MSQLVKTQQEEISTEILQRYIDSKLLPIHIKSVDQAYMIASMGRELKFPVIQSFSYITMIQGRPTLSAKAIGALLRRGGVTYKCTEDAVWVYPDGTGHSTNNGTAIDRRTTIVFKRGGQEEEVTYLLTDAKAAGYLDKDNWKRMYREMAYARALSKGANRIGADLLMGLYSTDEMFDTFDKGDIKVKRDEDGTILEVIETEYTEQ